MGKFIILAFGLFFTTLLSAQDFKTHILKINDHPLHVVTWGEINNVDKPAIVLLSGPIDSWHSDSAWWAGIGKALSETHRVIAIDRAGIATQNADAPLGYLPFAKDVKATLNHFKVQQSTLIAFASSNITAIQYFSIYPEQQHISRVVMIDPDVLTDFSAARYSSDAKPFRDNLEPYLAYIGEGKYIPRVEQKNAMDKDTITKLVGEKNAVEWALVDAMADARLNIINQQNLFKEIAIYGEELAQAKQLNWPASIPLIIIDTQFEQAYIAHTEDEEAKKGLAQWQADGKKYYQSLSKLSPNNRYIEVNSEAHLYQYAEPKALLNIVRKFSKQE